MKNNYFVFAALATFVLVACTKSRLETNESVSISSTKIIDLVMPSSSGLSGGKMVAINQSGHPTLDSTLSNFRFGLTDRTELYKNIHDIRLILTAKNTIPAFQNALKIKYGSVTYKMPFITRKADI